MNNVKYCHNVFLKRLYAKHHIATLIFHSSTTFKDNYVKTLLVLFIGIDYVLFSKESRDVEITFMEQTLSRCFPSFIHIL